MATLEEFMALCAASVFADESRPPAQDENLQAAKRRLLAHPRVAPGGDQAGGAVSIATPAQSVQRSRCWG